MLRGSVDQVCATDGGIGHLAEHRLEVGGRRGAEVVVPVLVLGGTATPRQIVIRGLRRRERQVRRPGLVEEETG